MIQEDFLHFVWQYQHFNSNQLHTKDGQPLEVIHTGHHNLLAGPDFKEASIKVGNVLWAGSVEIHIKSSDWKSHQHHGDPNYANVILHVVYEHNLEIKNPEGDLIPTLELKGLIKPGLLARYESFMKSMHEIPCTDSFSKVRVVTKLAMLESALVERLQRKSQLFKEILMRNQQDWEQSTYEWLARGFGFKTNADNMMDLAKAVPLKILLKHADKLQWEALLFGASGLLNTSDHDEYANQLRREYAFLERKYEVSSNLSYNQWHFARVRPTNFPTLRIAQFASLVHANPKLFSLFTQFKSIQDLQQLLEVHHSVYWEDHHNFGVQSKVKTKGLSKAATQSLMINTIAPLLVAYSDYRNNSDSLELAMNILMGLPVEDNFIIRKWQALGWNVNSGFDTQGLIELYNEYCSAKKCLRCKIGIELVKA
ncbi:MAG TPA: DUF2851 family protein [Roseivirga sp.]